MALQGSAALSQFRLGTVISSSLSVLGRNFLTFFVVSIVCLIPLVIVAMLVALLAAMSASRSFQSGNADFFGGGMVAVVVLAFAGVFTWLLIQSGISFGTFQAVRGERARIGPSISRAFAVLPRVFGATVVITVVMTIIIVAFMFLASIFLGSMFLGGTFTGPAAVNQGVGSIVGAFAMIVLAFVPIVFLAVVWWVVVPAIVVEHAGPISALGRSYRLVSGHRWAVLGLLVLVFVSNWLVSKVLEKLIGVVSSSMVAVSIVSIAGLLTSLFFMMLGAVAAAVGYYHLRAEKEGFGIGDLAGVFD